MSEDNRIKRHAFIYMNPKPPEKQFAQCGTCRDFTGTKCKILGMLEVRANDSCALYVHGKPDYGAKTQLLVSAEEAGFGKGSVRCENCKYFDAKESKCKLFDMLNNKLGNNFDLDINVHRFGCCNGFTRR